MLREVHAVFSDARTKHQLHSETIGLAPWMHQGLLLTRSKITYMFRAEKEARTQGRTQRLGIK